MKLETRDEIAAYFPSFEAMRWLGRGAAFPTAGDGVVLQAGDRFFRSDLLLECVYDGANWLTTFENVIPVVAQTQFASATTTNAVLVSTTDTYRITKITMSAMVATTNNASNYWSIQLQAMNDSFSAFTEVMGVTTASMAPNTYVRAPQTIVNAQIGVGRSALRVGLSKTGSPGDLRLALSVHLRFVIT